jgi:hypothetical protein
MNGRRDAACAVYCILFNETSLKREPEHNEKLPLTEKSYSPDVCSRGFGVPTMQISSTSIKGNLPAKERIFGFLWFRCRRVSLYS